MLPHQQYAYQIKAQTKTSPKIGQAPKIKAFKGHGSLYLEKALALTSDTEATDPFRS